MFGEVFTPKALVDEMLDKLPSHLWANPELTWLDPAAGDGNFLEAICIRLDRGLASAIPDAQLRMKHIVEQMLFGVEIQEKHANSTINRFGCQGSKHNIICADALNFNFWNMKFDIVVANPPYQRPREGRAIGQKTALWDKFVELTLDKLLKPEALMCFVHPARWRKPEDKLWEKLSSKQLVYIEIHNDTDGKKTFGASTRYDWYILQNKPRCTTTEVIGEDGKHSVLDLAQWPWLPNSDFDEIEKLLSKSDRKRILFSCAYHRLLKNRVSEQKTADFQYPVVHAHNKTKGLVLIWAKDKSIDHFGIPKVIFGESGNALPINDFEGNYGMSQEAMGLPVDSQVEAEELCKWLHSESALRLFKATRWSSFRIDHKMFRYFKDKFWEGEKNDQIID